MCNHKRKICRICTEEYQSMSLQKNQWNTKEGSKRRNEGQNKYKIDKNNSKNSNSKSLFISYFFFNISRLNSQIKRQGSAMCYPHVTLDISTHIGLTCKNG